MVRGTVSDALGGMPTVPSQGMTPQDVELSQYDHSAAADSVAGPSMQLRCVCVCNLIFSAVLQNKGRDVGSITYGAILTLTLTLSIIQTLTEVS